MGLANTTLLDCGVVALETGEAIHDWAKHLRFTPRSSREVGSQTLRVRQANLWREQVRSGDRLGRLLSLN
jgi:hypothetical protein